MFTINALGFIHGFGIKCYYRSACRPQGFHQYPTGCFAHIVGAWLEGQTPQRKGLAGQVALVMLIDLVEQTDFLALVHFLDRFQHIAVITMCQRCLIQRFHIFGQTGAAVAAAGMDELVANTWIRANPDAHVLSVGADQLGNIGDFVHETQFGSQHGVRGVLGHFSGTDVHEQ